MLQGLNNFTSLVLKLMAITAIVLAVLYFGVSIWGNIAISRANNPSLPDMPDISKAPYQVTVEATGQTLLAKEYVIIKADEPQIYELNNYYSLIDDKWVLVKSNVPLDEYYWGDITTVSYTHLTLPTTPYV